MAEVGAQAANGYTVGTLFGQPLASTPIGHWWAASPGVQSIVGGLASGAGLVNLGYAAADNDISPSDLYFAAAPIAFTYSSMFPGTEFTLVSTWTGPGKTPTIGGGGGWVQLGPPTWTNASLTGKPFPQMNNKGLVWPAFDVKNAASELVPTSSVALPAGSNAWRGLLGQRQIIK